MFLDFLPAICAHQLDDFSLLDAVQDLIFGSAYLTDIHDARPHTSLTRFGPLIKSLDYMACVRQHTASRMVGRSGIEPELQARNYDYYYPHYYDDLSV